MKLLSLGLLLGLAACSPGSQPADPSALVTHNDFEAAIGWAGELDATTKVQAHSGQYAIYVDQTREFSLTFNAPLSRLIAFRPRSLRLEAWVYLTDDNSTAKLGVQLVNSATDNTELFGDGIDLQEAAKVHKKWVKVSKTIVLPANVQPTQHLKVFLWRSTATSPVYADDLTITALE